MAQGTTLGLPKENKNRQPNKDKGRGIRKKKFLKFPQNSQASWALALAKGE